MTNIKINIAEYIKSNEILKTLDFFTAYMTIVELIKDEKLELRENV